MSDEPVPPLPDLAGVVSRKHSLTIAGHRTSISLEDPFWDGLCALAHARGASVSQLVTQIDATRADLSLSAAIRVTVLKYVQTRSGHFDESSAPRPKTM